MEIQHFMHEDPLVPSHGTENGIVGSCMICDSYITHKMPSYGCMKCGFYIHDYCARLERQIQQHADHPQHPLFLSLCGSGFLCSNCSRCRWSGYYCSECDSGLDLECALQNLDASSTNAITFQQEGHPLVLSRHPTLQNLKNCFVCDEPLEVPLFKCQDPDCLYRIHFHCAPLAFPKTIQHEHVHPLTFSERFTEDDSGEYYCDACEERRNPDIPVYTCIQCYSASAPYAAHMACVLSNEILQSLGESYEGTGRVKALQHHPHPLVLKEWEAPSQKCVACKSYVGWSLGIVCEQCEFVLHYGCRKLETEIKHPIHSQHSLILHVDANHIGPFFQCCACKEMCLGFIYRCDCCNFNLCARCIQCVQMTTRFNYQNHELFLFKFDAEGKCVYCGSDRPSPRFICTEPGCTYNMHFHCAPLSFPIDMKHNSHEHRLSLMNGLIDEEYENCYVCDHSFDKRDPFYSCEACNESAHLYCVLLEILPTLIAEYYNSPIGHKITRFYEELNRLRIDEKDLQREVVEMNAQWMAIESQLMEKKNELMEKSKSFQSMEAMIFQLEESCNVPANKERL